MDKKERKVGKRSPGYPMISLDEAIEKAKTLWEKDKNNLIPYEAVYKHLGFKSQAGYAARVIAALKKFDLIFEKQGSIMLTNEAIDLMLHSPNEEKYIEIIRKLALKPVIYSKILNEFNGTIPSDATLRVKLIKDHEFNPISVDDFIGSFRRTLAFAGLTGVQDIKQEEKGSDMQNQSLMTSQKLTPPPTASGTVTTTSTTSMQSFLIPISKGRKAAINFESLPIDDKDVKVIKDWLDLFSASLTEKNDL